MQLGVLTLTLTWPSQLVLSRTVKTELLDNLDLSVLIMPSFVTCANLSKSFMHGVKLDKVQRNPLNKKIYDVDKKSLEAKPINTQLRDSCMFPMFSTLFFLELCE